MADKARRLTGTNPSRQAQPSKNRFAPMVSLRTSGATSVALTNSSSAPTSGKSCFSCRLWETARRGPGENDGPAGIVDNGVGSAYSGFRQAFVTGRHDQVAAQQQVGLAGGNTNGLDGFLVPGDRTWLVTAPNFVPARFGSWWRSPCLRWAAMAISEEMVSTPVPPTPRPRYSRVLPVTAAGAPVMRAVR